MGRSRRPDRSAYAHRAIQGENRRGCRLRRLASNVTRLHRNPVRARAAKAKLVLGKSSGRSNDRDHRATLSSPTSPWANGRTNTQSTVGSPAGRLSKSGFACDHSAVKNASRDNHHPSGRKPFLRPVKPRSIASKANREFRAAERRIAIPTEPQSPRTAKRRSGRIGQLHRYGKLSLDHAAPSASGLLSDAHHGVPQPGSADL